MSIYIEDDFEPDDFCFCGHAFKNHNNNFCEFCDCDEFELEEEDEFEAEDEGDF